MVKAGGFDFKRTLLKDLFRALAVRSHMTGQGNNSVRKLLLTLRYEPLNQRIWLATWTY